MRIRPREPVSIMHKAKRPATGSQVQVTRCESEVHVHFSNGYEGVSKPAWFGAKRHSGQHRGIRPFHSSSFILHPFLPPCSSTAEHSPLKRTVPVRLRPGSPISSWKSNRTSAPERSRKPNVPREGMGSMPSDFRHFILHTSTFILSVRFRSSVERASLCESEGRRCDSCRKHHFIVPVAQ